jgi:glycosyltransferase involved in cell wall biosynthesis
MNAPIPLISVIIPCYNQARFLGAAIESVLSQSWSHREIIVINDGSTDNTSEVASHYPEVIFLDEKNQGRSAARNHAVNSSHGEYLVFLDADDLLMPDALTEGLNFMQQHPECGLVYGRYRLIEEDGNPIDCVPDQQLGEHCYYELLRRNCIGMMGTVLWRRDVFEETGGFNPQRQACEDYDLYLKIARHYPIKHHSYLTALYRQYKETPTLNARILLKAQEKLFAEQKPYIKDDPRYEKVIQEGLKHIRDFQSNKMLTELLRVAKHPGKWPQAFMTLCCLLRYRPGMMLRYFARKAGSLAAPRATQASPVIRRD